MAVSNHPSFPNPAPADGPVFYRDLADWWPLMSAPEDYAEEAEFYGKTLASGCERPPETVLELGSGGGNNASHLKRRFRMTLVDVAPGMIEVSRGLNPECAHFVGDIRTVRLGQTFDAVFIHDAIGYLTSEAELRQAMETAFVHCRPGGAVLIAPDHLRETFTPATDHGGHDGQGRSLRYLEWSWDPDPTDTTCLVDYVFALREADGSLRVIHDRHVEGIFPEATWLRLLREVGFQPSVVPFDHSELEPGSYRLFLGRKPAAA